VIKKGIIIFLVIVAFVDCWKQTRAWCVRQSQIVFKKALIESGIEQE